MSNQRGSKKRATGGHNTAHKGRGFQDYSGLRPMNPEREAELWREVAALKAKKEAPIGVPE